MHAFLRQFLEIKYYPDFVKKYTKKSSKNVNVTKKYYMQYSKKAHKVSESSDEIFYTTFFNKVKRKSDFCGKTSTVSPVLLQVNVPSFFPHENFFYLEQRFYFKKLSHEMILLYPTFIIHRPYKQLRGPI